MNQAVLEIEWGFGSITCGYNIVQNLTENIFYQHNDIKQCINIRFLIKFVYERIVNKFLFDLIDKNSTQI